MLVKCFNLGFYQFLPCTHFFEGEKRGNLHLTAAVKVLVTDHLLVGRAWFDPAPVIHLKLN